MQECAHTITTLSEVIKKVTFKASAQSLKINVLSSKLNFMELEEDTSTKLSRFNNMISELKSQRMAKSKSEVRHKVIQRSKALNKSKIKIKSSNQVLKIMNRDPTDDLA
ncbi:hypothetical protein Tco_0657208 [Tanacetum coccineum]|uniref:Uncharacterized protein n=1 Tax=Tanacetum coccineum TaxID=301880 RepID=A0ABQ4XAZ7_9ASTR